MFTWVSQKNPTLQLIVWQFRRKYERLDVQN
jgi:hypothetical protein